MWISKKKWQELQDLISSKVQICFARDDITSHSVNILKKKMQVAQEQIGKNIAVIEWNEKKGFERDNRILDNIEKLEKKILQMLDKPQPKKVKTLKNIRPSMEEVVVYASENNLDKFISPRYFYDYYAEMDWHDKYGTPVKNWKNKMRTWTRRNKERQGACSEPVIKFSKVQLDIINYISNTADESVTGWATLGYPDFNKKIGLKQHESFETIKQLIKDEVINCLSSKEYKQKFGIWSDGHRNSYQVVRKYS